jgi:hypothetical protein
MASLAFPLASPLGADLDVTSDSPILHAGVKQPREDFIRMAISYRLKTNRMEDEVIVDIQNPSQGA